MTRKTRRDQVVHEILSSADPRGAIRVVGARHGVNPGLAWAWALAEARKRAAARLPEEGLVARLLDPDQRARLIADADADRTLELANRLMALLPRCAATSDEIRALVAALPADGAQDRALETLLWHPAAPDDLLLALCDQERFITILGHRAGPIALLERLAERHAYPEAITTLALHHYGVDNYPLDAFVAFVRKHRGCFMLEHNLREGSRLSPERQRAALAALEM
jgi:hypothetical protein